MTYSDENDSIFYRINDAGNAAILYVEDGSSVTRLDENACPIGSDLSCRYEHPEGITLSLEDAKALGIPDESSCV